MVIETTQKVDPEIASDLLAGQENSPGFIYGYIRLDKHQVTMVTLHECAGGEPQKGQREVRLLSGTNGQEVDESRLIDDFMLKLKRWAGKYEHAFVGNAMKYLYEELNKRKSDNAHTHHD